MNFFDFVNLYRVNEVKGLMKKDSTGDSKNYQLAYEAGFNSKATFYRIFKKFSGQTPSDYRAMIE
jgi:AraC-like DNA-binding protein